MVSESDRVLFLDHKKQMQIIDELVENYLSLSQ